MSHLICTRLRTANLSVHVGDSFWRSEEIVKLLNRAFQCNHYHYHYSLLCLEQQEFVILLFFVCCWPFCSFCIVMYMIVYNMLKLFSSLPYCGDYKVSFMYLIFCHNWTMAVSCLQAPQITSLKVPNCATYLVICSSTCDLSNPLIWHLLWLPFLTRIDYQASVCFKVL